MARKKNKSDSGDLIGFLFIMLIVAVAFLVPFILLYVWLKNKFLVKNEMRYMAGDVSDFWLTTEEKAEYEQIYRRIRMAKMMIGEAEARGQEANITRNQDGSFSARSNLGKELRTVIEKESDILERFSAALMELAGKPYLRWGYFQNIYLNYRSSWYGLLTWLTLFHVRVLLFHDGFVEGYDKVTSGKFVLPDTSIDTYLTQAQLLMSNIPDMLIIALGSVAVFYGLKKFLQYMPPITPEPPEVQPDNIKKILPSDIKVELRRQHVGKKGKFHISAGKVELFTSLIMIVFISSFLVYGEFIKTKAQEEERRLILREVQQLSGECGTLLNMDGIDFVFIAPGEFNMGSPLHEQGRRADEMLHKVKISKGFWMGKYEVTQSQWLAVMGDNPSSFKSGDDYPVEQVSRHDVQEFIKKLNKKAASCRKKVDAETVWKQDISGCYRLPTEAEWEYAARAGTSTAFWTGDTISPEQANYYSDDSIDYGDRVVYREKTTAVQTFAPNPWGLYDMHGNVDELVLDWYDSDFYQKCGDDCIDPLNLEGDYSVTRGGNWSLFVSAARSAARGWVSPDSRYINLGFRLVLCR